MVITMRASKTVRISFSAKSFNRSLIDVIYRELLLLLVNQLDKSSKIELVDFIVTAKNDIRYTFSSYSEFDHASLLSNDYTHSQITIASNRRNQKIYCNTSITLSDISVYCSSDSDVLVEKLCGSFSSFFSTFVSNIVISQNNQASISPDYSYAGTDKLPTIQVQRTVSEKLDDARNSKLSFIQGLLFALVGLAGAIIGALISRIPPS